MITISLDGPTTLTSKNSQSIHRAEIGAKRAPSTSDPPGSNHGVTNEGWPSNMGMDRMDISLAVAS